MQYNLKGTNLDLTEEIRAYIDKKLMGLDALLHDAAAARADVELEYKASEEKTYRAELMLHDHGTLRAEARGQALHEALDRAIDELFAELTKTRKKKRHLVRRGATKIKDIVRGWRKE